MTSAAGGDNSCAGKSYDSEAASLTAISMKPGRSRGTDLKRLHHRVLFRSVTVLCQFALLIPATLRAQHPEGAEPHPVRAAEFILKTFDQYPMVGITDLPGCEELHNLIRSLIREPAFAGKVQDIIVDFGNPLLQPVVDRYLMDGEMTPRTLLRHVWDDTTRSVDLTWDSPVYEQFFDAVRSANSGLPRDKRLRVVLADSPVDWTSLKHPANLYPFLDSRSQVLASKVNASILAGRHALIIAFAEHLIRGGRSGNARQIIDRANPGKFFTILSQGRFGVGDGYRAIENAQLSWDPDTVTATKDTWLTSVATSSEANAPSVESAAEAVLYLGSSDSLTMLRPSPSVFQDESFWKELNRRWRSSKAAFQSGGCGLRFTVTFCGPTSIHAPNASAASPISRGRSWSTHGACSRGLCRIDRGFCHQATGPLSDYRHRRSPYLLGVPSDSPRAHARPEVARQGERHHR